MNPLETPRLLLVPKTRQEARDDIDKMTPGDRAHVSSAWLTLLENSGPIDPWIHGFRIVERSSGAVIGQCGFTGPPSDEQVVEIAYGVDPQQQGKGYGTEAAAALAAFAAASPAVRVIRAHTLPEPNASTRILTKCGFRHVGDFQDAEEGLVWRWEKTCPT